jgi:hypothetical protein
MAEQDNDFWASSPEATAATEEDNESESIQGKENSSNAAQNSTLTSAEFAAMFDFLDSPGAPEETAATEQDNEFDPEPTTAAMQSAADPAAQEYNEFLQILSIFRTRACDCNLQSGQTSCELCKPFGDFCYCADEDIDAEDDNSNCKYCIYEELKRASRAKEQQQLLAIIEKSNNRIKRKQEIAAQEALEAQIEAAIRMYYPDGSC